MLHGYARLAVCTAAANSTVKHSLNRSAPGYCYSFNDAYRNPQ